MHLTRIVLFMVRGNLRGVNLTPGRYWKSEADAIDAELGLPIIAWQMT
jgi:hypothetical protein